MSLTINCVRENKAMILLRLEAALKVMGKGIRPKKPYPNQIEGWLEDLIVFNERIFSGQTGIAEQVRPTSINTFHRNVFQLKHIETGYLENFLTGNDPKILFNGFGEKGDSQWTPVSDKDWAQYLILINESFMPLESL